MAAATSASPLCRTPFGALRTWLFVFALHLVQLDLSVPGTWRSGDRTPASEERRKPLGGGPPPTADKEQTFRRLRVCLFYRDSERAARRSNPGVWTGDSAPSLLPFTESPGRGGGIPEAFVRQPMLSRRLPWNAASRFHFPAAPVTPSAPRAEGESSLPSARKRLHSGVGERLPGTQFLARSLYRPVNTSGDTGWNPMRATPLDEEARLPPPRTEQG